MSDYEDYDVIHLKQSRAGHMSDLTKKRHQCEQALADGSSIYALKICLNAFERSFINFVASHERYLNAEENPQEKEKAINAYESHRDALLRMQAEISALEEQGQQRRSIASRTKASHSKMSVGSSRAEMERREAEIALEALRERHRLEAEEAEVLKERQRLRMQKEILKLETKKRIAEEKLKFDSSRGAASVTSGHKDLLEGRATLGAIGGKRHEEIHSKDSLEGWRLIAENIRQGSALPPIKLLEFDGNPFDYAEFIKCFIDHVEKNISDPSLLLTRLIAQCTGKAKEAIRSCVNLPSKHGYEEAKKALFQNFGQPYMVANSHIKRLKDVRIRRADATSLLEFYRSLENAYRTLSSLGYSYAARLDNEEFLKLLMRKLPSDQLRRGWSKIAGDLICENKIVCFRHFVDYVFKTGSRLNNPYADDLNNQSKSISTTVISNTRRPETPDRKQNDCVVCKGSHAIWTCSKFKEMNVDSRWEVVNKHKLCLSCLRQGHGIKNCRKGFKCKHPGCFKSHNTLLHNPRRTKPNANENKSENNSSSESPQESGEVRNSNQVSCCSKTDQKDKICFKIVPVRIKGPLKEVETYAFMDSGSDATLCLESLIAEIGMEPQSTRFSYNVRTLTGEKQVESKEVSFTITSIDKKSHHRLRNVLTTDSIPVDEQNLVNPTDLRNWPHLSSLKLQNIPYGKVTILIGMDHPELVECQLDIRRGKLNDPIAIKTPLGWTVCGKMGYQTRSYRRHVNLAISNGFEKTISEQLDRLYNTEFQDSLIQTARMSANDSKADRIMNQTIELVDGHYHIDLPFKSNPPKLMNNYDLARKRLFYLDKRLQRNEESRMAYHNVLKQYELEGAASFVGSIDKYKDETGWFLPHHGVWTSKKPNEPRVVFDCASKFNGTSLNDELLKGPDNTNALVGVILRFRVGSIAVTADIKRMFHQVFVPPIQRKYLRFLWWSSVDFSGEPGIYEMKVHVFGAKSSPSVCSYALRRTAEDNKEFSPEAVETVKRDFYVDDLVKSFETEKEAIDTCREVSDMVSKGGFKLTKWASNSRPVIENFKSEERASKIKDLNLEHEQLPSEKILGIHWDMEKDLLTMVGREMSFPSTRRGVLSSIFTIYDPIGMACPMLLGGREIHQELCKLKLTWDETLPDDIISRWKFWLDDLRNMHCKITRCFQVESRSDVKRCEVHNFSDASESHGYGTVSYLRFVYENDDIHCCFIYGRSRVRPLRRGITVPRLELTAATVSVAVNAMVVSELERRLRIDSITFWTDSMIVLHYLRAVDKEFDRFTSNRIGKILDGSNSDQWKYVASKENPADIASRGMRSDQENKVKKWLNGPEFLWCPEETWKSQPEVLQSSEDVISCSIIKTNITEFWKTLFERYSSWKTLLRTVARIIQTVENWKVYKPASSASGNKAESKPPLTVELLKQAEKKIVTIVQKELLARKQDLKQLQPVEMDGVLCVGGRLRNANVTQSSKHPIILPHNHPVTDFLILNCHLECGHQGINYTLSKLREHYWILRGVSAVKSILKRCHTCRRFNGRPGEQVTCYLPTARVNTEDAYCRYPFASVGVDLFGPFHVSLGPRTRGRKPEALYKRYGCIFTCMRTRAVHIEVVRDLSSDSFMQAITRFVARRGPPMEIYSDNGTNFKGSSTEITDAVKKWISDDIPNRLASRRIQWRFNPPASSHQGGVWERVIRSIRKILNSLISKNTLNDETLYTVFCEVEKILNDRPITRVSSDPNDLEALTPNHLLLLRRNSSSLPKDHASQKSLNIKWKYAQSLADQFWKQWIREYLPSLQSSQKWFQRIRNLSKGDLVLIVDENASRGSWRKGLVEEVFEDSEGCVRRAKIRIEDGHLVRDVRKLCLLEEDLV